MNEITLGIHETKILRINTNPIKSRSSKALNTGAITSILDITNIKKLEQIRTDFVSNVTHELKTPLTSIRGFIETLRGGAINDAEVADRFLEIIDIEAERLYMLINDILQLSEIETKQRDINISRFNMKDVVRETFSILSGTAEKKKIALIEDIDQKIRITANRDGVYP